ncbi:MAG: translation initiation factor IF-3 [bacterium]
MIKYRINDQIKTKEVRVIDENNVNLGIMNIKDALKLADSKNLDLVEVAPEANPPVCKIVDYGKFRYELIKKEKNAKKNQKKQELKEIIIKNKIDKSGINIKVQMIKRILEEGDKVKIVLQLLGKSKFTPDKFKPILQEVLEQLGDIKIEKDISIEDKNMYVIVSPKN